MGISLPKSYLLGAQVGSCEGPRFLFSSGDAPGSPFQFFAHLGWWTDWKAPTTGIPGTTRKHTETWSLVRVLAPLKSWCLKKFVGNLVHKYVYIYKQIYIYIYLNNDTYVSFYFVLHIYIYTHTYCTYAPPKYQNDAENATPRFSTINSMEHGYIF